MTWIDAASFLFALVTIALVVRNTQSVTRLLDDARYERRNILRRLEVLTRRIDTLDGSDPIEDESPLPEHD
jgi:hypothetical protein